MITMDYTTQVNLLTNQFVVSQVAN